MKNLRIMLIGGVIINLIGIISLTSEVNEIKNLGVESNTQTDAKINGVFFDLVVSTEENVKKFNYTFNAFKRFNNDIDSCTVVTFLEVVNHFRLDSTEQMFKWSVGQVILESGAKQYYQTGHPKAGQLVKSPNGAIGFCQIIPTTALGYFRKRIDSSMVETMHLLGASDFSFAYDESIGQTNKLSQTTKWLTDETNNIILWAVIMRIKIDKDGGHLRALVGYNSGTNSMLAYVNNGGNLHNHSYIRGIESKLTKVGPY